MLSGFHAALSCGIAGLRGNIDGGGGGGAEWWLDILIMGL